jgi:2-oxoglutarate dehydrogenase E2 component (dihydrolipoamide succinyltransferase)
LAEIRAPRLNSNDEAYILLEWLVADGAWVGADDAVVVLETSKTAEEITAGAEGWLRQLRAAGDECGVGVVLGVVLDSAGSAPAVDSSAPAADPISARPGDGGRMLVTAPAKALAEELDVDEALLRALGKSVVRQDDVRRLHEQRRTAGRTPQPVAAGVGVEREIHRLPRHQLAVAQVVSRSHATIPQAFTAVEVTVDAALAFAQDARKSLRTLIGLPEILVFALARIQPRFPLFFATPMPDGTVRLGGVHVGVAIDVGNGLQIPVIADADRRGLKEIGQALLRFRLAAMRRELTQEQLSGGTITVTLHHDDAVLVAVPLVRPGEVCALSLGAVRHRVDLDAATGQVRQARVATLGAAYDHRVVNGRDVVLFLRALRLGIESVAGEAGTGGVA